MALSSDGPSLCFASQARLVLIVKATGVSPSRRLSSQAPVACRFRSSLEWIPSEASCGERREDCPVLSCPVAIAGQPLEASRGESVLSLSSSFALFPASRHMRDREAREAEIDNLLHLPMIHCPRSDNLSPLCELVCASEKSDEFSSRRDSGWQDRPSSLVPLLPCPPSSLLQLLPCPPCAVLLLLDGSKRNQQTINTDEEEHSSPEPEETTSRSIVQATVGGLLISMAS
jgi:hypothetical protein